MASQTASIGASTYQTVTNEYGVPGFAIGSFSVLSGGAGSASNRAFALEAGSVAAHALGAAAARGRRPRGGGAPVGPFQPPLDEADAEPAQRLWLPLRRAMPDQGEPEQWRLLSGDQPGQDAAGQVGRSPPPAGIASGRGDSG